MKREYRTGRADRLVSWGRGALIAVVALCVVSPGARGQAIDYFPPIEFRAPVVKMQVHITSGAGAASIVNGRDIYNIPDGSGKRFLCTAEGNVLLYNAAGMRLSTPYLSTVNERTGDPFTVANQGMKSIAVHPGFADPLSPGYGKFYTLTTESLELDTHPPDFIHSGIQTPNHHTILTEWTANDPTAVTFSGASREMIRFHQAAQLHDVNDLEFDRDGMLLISAGDDGARFNAQNLTNPYGKVIRIDPLGNNSVNGKYGVPADNPFVGQAGVLPEIFSYGFRNPYRLTIDKLTGEFWVGDVGDLSIEEVDKIAAGNNYGWPLKEGSFLFDPLNPLNLMPDLPDGNGQTLADRMNLVDPVFEYDHTDGVVVVAGYVYRGTAIPQLYGKFVFAEWFQSRVFYGDPETGEFFQFQIDTPVGQPTVQRPLTFGEDLAGELYLQANNRVFKMAPLSIPGDYNLDGLANAADIDLIFAQQGSMDRHYDVDIDGGATDGDDVRYLVRELLDTQIGDANLDGKVNITDLSIVATSFGGLGGWALGNFNGVDGINITDLSLLATFFGFDRATATATPTSVPVPGAAWFVVATFAAGRLRRKN